MRFSFNNYNFSRDLEIRGYRTELEDQTAQYARIVKDNAATISNLKNQLNEFKNMSSSCNSELGKCLKTHLVFNRDNRDLELENIAINEELERYRKVNRNYRKIISVKNIKLKKMRLQFKNLKNRTNGDFQKKCKHFIAETLKNKLD